MQERSTRLAKLTNQSTLLIKISVFTKLEDSFFGVIYLEKKHPSLFTVLTSHFATVSEKDISSTNETDVHFPTNTKKAKKIGLPVFTDR